MTRKNKKFIVDLNEFESKLCKDCKDFISKFKPWDESKVPEIAAVKYFECEKCKMTYEVFKGMVWPVPLMSPEEKKEFYSTEEVRKITEMGL